MADVRKLEAQTEAFWRDEYAVSGEDVDLVAGVVLEAGKPQAICALTSAIILRRLQREREAVAKQAQSGEVYQPKETYEVGQALVFTALGFAPGRVVGTRPGQNPRYGDFAVIQVAFDDGSEREFASRLDHAHPLNRPAEELLGGADPDLPDAEVVKTCDVYVAQRLQAVLDARNEFVQFSDRWYLAELLPEINEGHLNLAEALIDQLGHPIAAREMIHDLDLVAGAGAEGAPLFALNSALAADGRFDNVSITEEPVWFLHALEPEELTHPPVILQNGISAVGGEHIGVTMIDLVEDVGDELDDVHSDIVRASDQFAYRAIFPHLYAGTMPAWADFMRLLPSTEQDHFALDMVDGRSGNRYQAWVVPSRRYICGLRDWYRDVGMAIGGRIVVTPTEEPLTFQIATEPARGRSNAWLRSVQVTRASIGLQMRDPRGISYGVQFDPHMFVEVPETASVAALMAEPQNANMPIGELVRTAFHHLAGLTGTGHAHAKSIYAVANLIRRTGTVPVFAELTRQACFDPMGDGLWAYDRSLDGRVYETADDMRERPLSNRDNVMRDQAVPYIGR